MPLEPTDQDDLFSDEKDSLILGSVAGEYDFVKQDNLILGAGISRFQSWHMDLDEYEASDTTLELYGRYLADPFTYGLQVSPSIYQLDGDNYLFTTHVRPEVSYTVNQQLSVWLSYTFSNRDYRKRAYDDRDSDNHEVFLDTVYILGGDKGYALGGIGYEYNDASAGEDGTDQFSKYDDSGVDQVGVLEGVLPDGTDDRRRYADFEKKIKPWTPSEIDTIKESITEEELLGMPPDNPDNRTFPLPN